MKKVILLLIGFAVYMNGFTQPGSTIAEIISGKVIDQVTNEPISYTNIGLENTLIGTASNAEGSFQLRIPKDMVDRNIYFSALGFKNDTFAVSQLFGREFSIIKLEPRSYDIEHVDIAEKSKVFIRILRMASENIPYNFIGGPLNFEGKYTNQKTVDDTLNFDQNIDVLIFDKTGYSIPSKLNAYQHRNYSITKENQTADDFTFESGTTNLDELLELDFVRTASSVLDPEILDRFTLTLKDEPIIDGNPAWVIGFNEPEPSLPGSGDYYAVAYSGEITINKEDYAVRKISGKVRSLKNNRQGKSLAIGQSNSNFLKDVSYEFTVEYSNLKPDRILMNRSFRLDNKNISEQSELKIEKVQTTNLTELERREYFTGE